jgi:glycosyltransferase involved in cell wall biosynthesis
VGGFIKETMWQEIRHRQRPEPEYATFQRRNQTILLSFNNIGMKQAPLNDEARRAAVKALSNLAVMEGRRFDVIIASGENIGLPLFLNACHHRLPAPIFVITHGTYFDDPGFKDILVFAAGRKNIHFVCLAESIRSIMISRFRLPKEQVHNAGYGVDTNFFRPQRTRNRKSMIVSAGTAVRDYKTLLQASSHLDVPITIAADSEWFPLPVEVEQPLSATIQIRSFGNYLNLRNLYRAATVIVVPLYPALRACGYAVISEAMAMGKTVLATKTDGHSDFIQHGINGYYFNPCDAHKLRALLEMVLSSPAIRDDVGRAARADALNKFSIEAYCDRIEGLITSILHK